LPTDSEEGSLTEEIFFVVDLSLMEGDWLSLLFRLFTIFFWFRFLLFRLWRSRRLDCRNLSNSIMRFR
jgi:hypothetical protein